MAVGHAGPCLWAPAGRGSAVSPAAPLAAGPPESQ
jgi:hypothetical protein